MSTARISLALNFLLAILCVGLLLQNRALKQGAGGAAGAALKPGTRLAPFGYRTLDGRQATLAFVPGRRYLLFVVSTTCPWCERSLPEIDAIAREVVGTHVQPLAVSIHDPAATATFAADHHVRFELVSAVASDDFQRAYEIEGVPTTILLDGGGVVLRVWEGNITPGVRGEIEAAARRS